MLVLQGEFPCAATKKWQVESRLNLMYMKAQQGCCCKGTSNAHMTQFEHQGAQRLRLLFQGARCVVKRHHITDLSFEVRTVWKARRYVGISSAIRVGFSSDAACGPRVKAQLQTNSAANSGL